MSGMSARKGMAISWPLKSAKVCMLGSREIIHNTPHCETLSNARGAPRLYKLAATLVGIAIKSTLPLSAKARNWSGLLQRINSTSSAISAKPSLASKWIKPLETPAGGPAITSFFRGNVGLAKAVVLSRLKKPHRPKQIEATILLMGFTQVLQIAVLMDCMLHAIKLNLSK